MLRAGKELSCSLSGWLDGFNGVNSSGSAVCCPFTIRAKIECCCGVASVHCATTSGASSYLHHVNCQRRNEWFRWLRCLTKQGGQFPNSKGDTSPHLSLSSLSSFQPRRWARCHAAVAPFYLPIFLTREDSGGKITRGGPSSRIIGRDVRTSRSARAPRRG